MVMPIIQVDVLKGRLGADKKRLLDAIHEALVEAFEIPDDDRVQILNEHEADDFDVPVDGLAIVTITMFPGRSLAAKRKLYEGIAMKVGDLGIDPRDVMVVLNERPLDDWGIRGGKAASDVDLGFDLDV